MASALSTAAPSGAHFEFQEIFTKKGTQTLGSRPILKWDSLDGVRGHITDEGVLRVCNGTSLDVSYESIARRMAIAGKSDDEIAVTQVAFRPGERKVGESTPTSRASRAARVASEKLGGTAGDTIAAFLERVANGEISEEELLSAATAGRR